MLSVFLLCIAMFSAAWAYTSMMKSGEFTMGGMPVKYKIILIIYIIVAFFILWAGGPIVFIIYAAIAGIGSACGWFFTKNNEDDNTGKQELRIPVRLQVINNANASITDYTKKTNANNMLTTVQQSDDDNKITKQSTNTNSNASTADTDNNNSQQTNSTNATTTNDNSANNANNSDSTTTTNQLESDSDNDSTSDVNASVSNHVNTDKNDSDLDNAR